MKKVIIILVIIGMTLGGYMFLSGSNDAPKCPEYQLASDGFTCLADGCYVGPDDGIRCKSE